MTDLTVNLTTLLQAIVLGLVQGVTEFLPISSTAHLLIFTEALHWNQVGEKYFIDGIQFGSVIAVILYFWKDLRHIGSGSWHAIQTRNWQRDEWKLMVGIGVGTIPALVGGYLLKDQLPESPVVIAWMSIVMSFLLGVAETIGRRQRQFSSLTVQDGLIVGLGQMVALIPGASRSGATLTTALLLGLERQTAARFSFLLGIPTLTIATLYQARQVFFHIDSLLPLVVGIVSTFIFSYGAIAWLLRFLQTQNTWIFIWYRLAFGIFILVSVTHGLLKSG
ncbi:MAG: undecaprenyl-diphosphate phosphatase [Cyanobacteria bacterium WB6_1B_304]|jgi:undecaprenyl-diphosphatase|nr:undecaprenyl-diphosphate phosphatase [Cyanobacteria bacterium WB6_1B_304]